MVVVNIIDDMLATEKFLHVNFGICDEAVYSFFDFWDSKTKFKLKRIRIFKLPNIL